MKISYLVIVCSILAAFTMNVAFTQALTDSTVFKPGLSWMSPETRNEVQTAVKARRGKTELSKLAASMEPGTWAELKTGMKGGIYSTQKLPG